MTGGVAAAQRLERFLAAVAPGRRATVRSCRAATGGYSRTTHFAEVGWDDGTTDRLVLRADPAPGTTVFTSDRDAEWRLLQALAAPGARPGFRVAPPRWYDATGEFFGGRCIVSELVPGRSLQEVAAAADDLDVPVQAMVETFAAVHAVPLDDLPAGLVRPDSLGSALDEVADAYSRVERQILDSSPVLAFVGALLRTYRPPAVPFTLVHGDCQPGNVLVPPEGLPVVIDWEFARIGDPRADLGYYRQMPLQPNLYTVDKADFLARYRAVTGLSAEQVNPEVVDFFLVVGMATLLVQLLEAADAVAAGQRRGALATYLLNAISLQYDLFLDVAGRLALSR